MQPKTRNEAPVQLSLVTERYAEPNEAAREEAEYRQAPRRNDHSERSKCAVVAEIHGHTVHLD